MEADKSPTLDEYKYLLLMIIIKNELQFPSVESESYREFVHFLRDDPPKIRRATMRRRLNATYEKEFQILKGKVHDNTGIYSITIEEWRSGNNFYVLGITLHFYNNEFELENHTIEFEGLKGKFSYTDEVLYEVLMKVLKIRGIEIESNLSQETMRRQ